MANNSQVNQHHRLAMGENIGHGSAKFAKGGRVAPLKSGLPTSPVTDAKRANGVPGFKKGGKSK